MSLWRMSHLNSHTIHLSQESIRAPQILQSWQLSRVKDLSSRCKMKSQYWNPEQNTTKAAQEPRWLLFMFKITTQCETTRLIQIPLRPLNCACQKSWSYGLRSPQGGRMQPDVGACADLVKLVWLVDMRSEQKRCSYNQSTKELQMSLLSFKNGNTKHRPHNILGNRS